MDNATRHVPTPQTRRKRPSGMHHH
uniref:Uncharacterized protein n=1 Tax=Arundo donax TaxID=35708 RepID=A0A0A9FUJ6_ARUDO